jgi:hypothetical protein
MQSAHKDVVIRELKADEALEVGKCTTLKTLKEDYGAVEKFSGDFKQRLDEQFVKWCCKKRRGLSIGETDRELKAWMLQATRGRYQPPSKKTAMNILITMRVKADNTTKKMMLKLRAERVLPSISGTFLSFTFTFLQCVIFCQTFILFCILISIFMSSFAGDIWSENGIAIFAIMVHFIDSEWKLNTRLALCKGLDKIAHTGDNIEDITYKGLFDAGLGPDLATIHEDIHVCTPDEGSNMLKAWGKIEGAGCVCHRQQNCLGAALSLPCILPILKKIKAACAHFHRSDKVPADSLFLIYAIFLYMSLVYAIYNTTFCFHVEGYTYVC